MKLAEWPYVARENKNLEKNFIFLSIPDHP